MCSSDLGIKTVCPLPYEREQEAGREDRLRVRQHDADKSLERAAAVHVGSLLHLLWNIAEELPDHIDIKSVLQPHTAK